MWLNGLWIWYCHCTSLGGCYAVGSFPGLGASTYHRCSQKKGERKKEKKKTNIKQIFHIIECELEYLILYEKADF